MTNTAAHESAILKSDRKAVMRSIDTLSALAERNRTEDLCASLTTLSEMLLKNRFNLAVLGQMKRGKSSIINALLDADRLRTGILPLTFVITPVKHGTDPEAQIIYKSGQSEPIAVGALHEYITEAANPGNRKQVVSAEGTSPSQFLGMSVDLIGTPGIGSTHLRQSTGECHDELEELAG